MNLGKIKIVKERAPPKKSQAIVTTGPPLQRPKSPQVKSEVKEIPIKELIAIQDQLPNLEESVPSKRKIPLKRIYRNKTTSTPKNNVISDRERDDKQYRKDLVMDPVMFESMEMSDVTHKTKADEILNNLSEGAKRMKSNLESLKEQVKKRASISGQPLIQNLGGGLGHREVASATERVPPKIESSSCIAEESRGSIISTTTVNLSHDQNEEKIDKTNVQNSELAVVDLLIQTEKNVEMKDATELTGKDTALIDQIQVDTKNSESSAAIIESIEELKNDFKKLQAIAEKNLPPAEQAAVLKAARIMDPKLRAEKNQIKKKLRAVLRQAVETEKKLRLEQAKLDVAKNDDRPVTEIRKIENLIAKTEKDCTAARAEAENLENKIVIIEEKNNDALDNADVKEMSKSFSTLMKNFIGTKAESLNALYGGVKSVYSYLSRHAEQASNIKALIEGLGSKTYALIGKAKQLYDNNVGALLTKIWKSKENPNALSDMMEIDEENMLENDANQQEVDKQNGSAIPPPPPQIGKDRQSQGYLDYFANEFMDILQNADSPAPPAVIEQIITDVVKPTPQWNDNVFQYLFALDEQKEIVDVSKQLLSDKVIEKLNATVSEQIKLLLGNQVESSYAIERYTAMIMNLLSDNKINGLRQNDAPSYLKDLNLNNSALPNIWGKENLENRPSKFAEGNDYYQMLENTMKAFEEIINEKKKTGGEDSGPKPKRRGRKPKAP